MMASTVKNGNDRLRKGNRPRRSPLVARRSSAFARRSLRKRKEKKETARSLVQIFHSTFSLPKVKVNRIVETELQYNKPSNLDISTKDDKEYLDLNILYCEIVLNTGLLIWVGIKIF